MTIPEVTLQVRLNWKRRPIAKHLVCDFFALVIEETKHSSQENDWSWSSQIWNRRIVLPDVCVFFLFVCLFCFVCFFLYCCLFIGFNFSFLFSSFWLEKKKTFWGENPIKNWRLFLDYPKFSHFQALGWNRVYWHSCAPFIITEELTLIINQVINRGTWISKKKTQKSVITVIYKLKIAYSFNWKEVIK